MADSVQETYSLFHTILTEYSVRLQVRIFLTLNVLSMVKL